MVSIAGTDLRRVAEELAQVGRAQAERSESERRAPAELVAGLRKLSRLAAPARCGGRGLQPGELLDLIRCVANGDGAAAWLTMIYMTSAAASHWVPVPGQDEIWAQDSEPLLAGVVAPRGNAVPGPDGYVISGRWQFGSGAGDADWVGLGAVMADTGRSAVFHVPRSEVLVIDTWDSLGLRATASHDLAVDGTVVPGHRIAFLDGPAHTEEATARFPVFGLLAAGIGAVAIGVGQAAVIEIIQLAGGKTPTGSKRRLADRGSVQEMVARSQADLEASWTYLASVAADGSGRADLEQKVRLRLAATKAMETGRDVVDRLYTLAGGSSLYAKSPLQRYLRDLHTASQHMMVAQPTWELTGRVLLGLDGDPTGL